MLRVETANQKANCCGPKNLVALDLGESPQVFGIPNARRTDPPGQTGRLPGADPALFRRVPTATCGDQVGPQNACSSVHKAAKMLASHTDERAVAMAEKSIRIDLGAVDFDSLHSEADYRREATRLLPKVLTELGQAQGELAWNEMQKAFRGVAGFKANSSAADKRKFIREAGENYRKEIGAAKRTALIDNIVDNLKAQTSSEGMPMPISFSAKEKEILRYLKGEYLTNGGRPQHLSGPGALPMATIMKRFSLTEIEYREIMGQFEHFGYVEQICLGASNEWLAINTSILAVVRSLDEPPATPPPSTVHNTMNIGTMNNSAIQQGSPGATQTVSISIEERCDVDKILKAVAVLVEKMQPADANEVNAEMETINSQLKKSEPKRTIIKESLIGIRSSLEKIAGHAVAVGAGMATTDVVQQITALITAWGG